jgi:hypothetical protein
MNHYNLDLLNLAPLLFYYFNYLFYVYSLSYGSEEDDTYNHTDSNQPIVQRNTDHVIPQNDEENQ